MNSFSPPSPRRWRLLSRPFYRWGNGGTETVSDLPKVHSWKVAVRTHACLAERFTPHRYLRPLYSKMWSSEPQHPSPGTWLDVCLTPGLTNQKVHLKIPRRHERTIWKPCLSPCCEAALFKQMAFLPGEVLFPLFPMFLWVCFFLTDLWISLCWIWIICYVGHTSLPVDSLE